MEAITAKSSERSMGEDGMGVKCLTDARPILMDELSHRAECIPLIEYGSPRSL